MASIPHLGFLLVFLQHAISSLAQIISSPPSFQSNSSSTMVSTSSSTNQSISTVSPSLTSSAQFPSLSGYSSCVSNCLAVGIARVNCTSIIDVNCFCIHPAFPREVVGCVLSNCPSELLTEEDLAQQFCKLASGSPTLTFPTITSSTTTSSSSTSTSSSTLSSVTATQSSAAIHSFTTTTLPRTLGIGLLANILGFALGMLPVWC